MEFRITGVSPNLIKRTTIFPNEYLRFKCSFASAYIVTSPDVDIIYHVRTVNGSTLSNNIFIVRKRVRLLPTVDGPFSAVNCMLRGSVEVHLKNRFNEAEYLPIWLNQGEYNAFQVDARIENPHEAWFEPGIYEAHHFDYSRDALSGLGEDSPLIKQWVFLIDHNHSEPIMKMPDIVWDGLLRAIDDLKGMTVENDIEANLFENKLREVLVMILDREEVRSEGLRRMSHKYDIKSVLNYVVNNLHEPFTLEILAKVYKVGVSKLRKDFVKESGLAFSRYLLRVRMETARKLLRGNHDYAIGEVSVKVGYQNPASFSREYRKFYGLTPKEEKQSANWV